MKRSAFTLIELILVILLTGVLAIAVTSLTRPDRLLNDTKFVAAKIMKTRYEAVGYDHRNFDGTFQTAAVGCITLDRAGLEDNRSKAGSYRLSERTQIHVSTGGNVICFDAKGRPHESGFDLASLLHRQVDINISDGKKSYTIVVYPISGYVSMKR